MNPLEAGAQLAEFIADHSPLVVLTGAGVSTASGIPDYRDVNGQWKRAQPVTFQAFMGAELTRQRYWARSLVGWRTFGQARPGPAIRGDAASRLACAMPRSVSDASAVWSGARR